MATSQATKGDLRAFAIFASYLLTCASLTGLLCRDLYKRYHLYADGYHRRLKPSSPSNTSIQTFTMISVLCLGITWYYMLSFFSLSYRFWAEQDGEKVLLMPQGSKFSIQWIAQLQLGAWLKDVQLFREAWETAMETPDRLFWSQPIFFITAAWSLYISNQARLRAIPHPWAYMLLGQIVAISFAQNLFFLAVLLHGPVRDETQAPAQAQKRPRSTNKFEASWYTLPGIVHAIVLVSTVVPVAMVPSVVTGPYFLQILALPHIALLLPPIWTALIRRSTFDQQTEQKDRRLMSTSYKLILVAGVILQIKVGVNAFRNTSTHIHLHRHSNIDSARIDMQDSSRVGLSRGVQALVNGFHSHPAVSSVGSDALLCLGSYALWLLITT